MMYTGERWKNRRKKQAEKTAENKRKIIVFLTEEGSSRAVDIADYIGLSSLRARVLLFELTEEGRVKPEGNGRARRYLLAP